MTKSSGKLKSHEFSSKPSDFFSEDVNNIIVELNFLESELTLTSFLVTELFKFHFVCSKNTCVVFGIKRAKFLGTIIEKLELISRNGFLLSISKSKSLAQESFPIQLSTISIQDNLFRKPKFDFFFRNFKLILIEKI